MNWTPPNSQDVANILDAVPEAYVRLDSEFRYTFANRATEQLLGKSCDELLGNVLWEVYPALLGTPFEEHYRCVMTERVPVTFENWYEPWQRWYAITAAPDSDGGIVVHTVDVTERKRAEDALRKSETMLSRSQEIAHVGSWELDVVANRLSWTDEVYRMFGLRPQEFKATYEAFLEAVHPEDRAAVDAAYTGSLREGRETYEIEHRVVRRDTAEILHVHEKCLHLRDAAGRIVRSVGMVQDITGRKRAEDALRTSERQFRSVLETISLVGVVLDRQGNITLCNDFLLALTGWKREEVLGRNWFALFLPPNIRGEVEEMFLETIGAGETPVHFQNEMVTRQGARRQVSWNNTVIRDPGGQIAGVASIGEDITQRQQAEEELKKRNAFVETLLENAPIGFAVNTISDGRRVFMSRNFEKIYGVAPDSIHSVADFFEKVYLDPVFREKIRGRIMADTATGEAARMRWEDIPITTQAGEHRVVTAMDIPLPEQDLMISTVQDVTARKALEAQLQQAQKMESIGRLAGGLAHDFNNLLTVINGYSHLLLGKLAPGDPACSTLQEIYKAGERAAGLTSQLLAFSRKQVLQPRVLDLNHLVGEMRSMLMRLVGEDVEVCVKSGGDAGKVYADPHQLEQVVMNLAVNARDALPHGGRLLIETASVELDQAYAQSHPDAVLGRYVMLAVSDNGVGMDEETRRKIFEPFFTTKGVGRGTGLGLSMVQGIVAQSGGYIEVYSEPGHGTSFNIYLPRLEDAAEVAGIPEAVPARGGKETVLVVEDQQEVREYAATVLQEYGYRVIQAENAGDALSLWEREGGREHIDLLLSDVVMPKMGGRELAARIEEFEPGIKILLMSGYTDSFIERHGILDAGTEFILKPFSPGQLAAKVREVLGSP